jgi:hypothetical protein
MSIANYLTTVLSALPVEHRGPIAALIPPLGLLDNHDETVKDRAYIEYLVIRSAIDELIDNGYSIDVDDGDDEPVIENSVNPDEIIRSIFAVDEAYIVTIKNTVRVGGVRLILGNSGWDVISDYTTNLEKSLKKTNALADQLSN